MKLQSDVNRQVDDVAGRLPDNTALPKHTFNAQFSQKNADDLESLFGNKGFGPHPSFVPPEQRPLPAGRGKRVSP